MKHYVVILHGGDVHRTYEEYLEALKTWEVTEYELGPKPRWREWLPQALGESYTVAAPQMPNPQNAKYDEWKIRFERLTPLFDDEVVLIGHSLGGIFLTKYLSENAFPKKIRALFLVSASHDGVGDKHKLWSTFKLPSDLSGVEKQAGKIFLYHSMDDAIVPFSDFEKYKKELSHATFRSFSNRGHFRMAEFPELLEDIRSVE